MLGGGPLGQRAEGTPISLLLLREELVCYLEHLCYCYWCCLTPAVWRHWVELWGKYYSLCISRYSIDVPCCLEEMVKEEMIPIRRFSKNIGVSRFSVVAPKMKTRNLRSFLHDDRSCLKFHYISSKKERYSVSKANVTITISQDCPPCNSFCD